MNILLFFLFLFLFFVCLFVPLFAIKNRINRQERLQLRNTIARENTIAIALGPK